MLFTIMQLHFFTILSLSTLHSAYTPDSLYFHSLLSHFNLSHFLYLLNSLQFFNSIAFFSIHSQLSRLWFFFLSLIFLLYIVTLSLFNFLVHFLPLFFMYFFSPQSHFLTRLSHPTLLSYHFLYLFYYVFSLLSSLCGSSFPLYF